MFKTTPIADIKTSKLVEPAEINGNGKPVGGIEPVTTAMLSITWIAIIAPMPKHKNAENLLLERMPILKIFIISNKKTAHRAKHPTKPNSSAIIEKIKSDSLKGKNNSACLLLNSPTPQTPPLPMA